MLAPALSIFAGIIAAFVTWATIMPFIRVGHWVARVCDFPRPQITSIALLGSAIAAAALALDQHIAQVVILALCLIVAGVQTAQMLPYTRLWKQTVPDPAPDHSTLRLLIANIDYTNGREQDVADAITDADADVLLLVEINERWNAALESVCDRFPWSEGVVRETGVGLTLHTRVKPDQTRVEHLVSEDRASIHGIFRVDAAAPLRFVALHPTPPGLDNFEADNGRTHSRRRDAELITVAKHIRDQPDAHWIVFGDLNDVAWSHTTRLFCRLSGMKDPRIGRKLLNTFHARQPWLRYPLDHVFVSPALSVARLDRIRLPGSDHFGVLVEIGIPPDRTANNTTAAHADPDDHQEAADIRSEGKQQARENNAEPHANSNTG